MHLRSTGGDFSLANLKQRRINPVIFGPHFAPLSFAGSLCDIDGIPQCKHPQNRWFLTREGGNLSRFAAAWANIPVDLLRLNINERMDSLEKVETIANASHKRKVPKFYQALCLCVYSTVCPTSILFAEHL
jgi:hypothetical protein